MENLEIHAKNQDEHYKQVFYLPIHAIFEFTVQYLCDLNKLQHEASHILIRLAVQ